VVANKEDYCKECGGRCLNLTPDYTDEATLKELEEYCDDCDKCGDYANQYKIRLLIGTIRKLKNELKEAKNEN
jgi:hypothetical protein